jgi:SAM-dependent methyltransferase
MHPKTAAFADVADAYERGRPGYPQEIVTLLELGPGVDVVDVGAGTGKLTRVLVASGATVTAVEPLPRLRERISGATALEGTAERLPLDDASVDAATVGEAGHWFDHGAAADELARVVRPGGMGARVWQSSDPQARPAWMQRTWDIVRAHRGDHPAFGDDEAGRPALDTHPAFDGLRHVELSHMHHTDHEGVVAEAASISYIAAMDAHARATLLAQLAAVVPRGSLDIPYRTDVYLTTRTSHGGPAPAGSGSGPTSDHVGRRRHP